MNFRGKRPVQRNERWVREDAAPRLSTVIPQLSQLRLNVREMREGHPIQGTTSVRHVVVTRASTLFEFACSEPKCEGGGYDATDEILSGLRRGEREFQGTCDCPGNVLERPCQRVLEFTVQAEYVTPPKE